MTMTDSPTYTSGGLDVTRLSGSLGAEVRGFALGPGAPAEELRALVHEHLVLLFPDQSPTPEDHIAFGKLFGELEEPHFDHTRGDRPEFFEVRATAGQGGVADEWHSDSSFAPSPSRYSVLHMKVCPPFGGDTIWANTAKAYDALSAPLRDLCDGLTALHDASSHFQSEKACIHPVVRIHPETGSKSLFVNHSFTRRIVELSYEESEMLLSYLVSWIQRPNFAIRYSWDAGTVAMWDNRTTQHYVCNDFEGERVLQRVTISGDNPQPASPPRWEPHELSLTAAAWRDRPMIEYLARD